MLLSGLFETPLDLFDTSKGLPGAALRGPSRLSARRLRQRHAGFGPGVMWRQATDRLFFALLPDPETAERLQECGEQWRARLGLTGRLLRSEHLHITLHHAGAGTGTPPPDLVEALAERAAMLAMPAIRVEFDRVKSFPNGAFVMSGGDASIGLEVLNQRLSDALDASPRPARRFTPHLTLLRDGRQIEEQPIEPIGWAAREVVLVHSLPGQTGHRHLARVPLRQA